MALIGKIRKNFWFVLLVLGLALAAFILMDMTSAGNRGGMGPQQVVGEVAGTKIDYQDFQKVEQALYSGNSDNFAAKSGVWNYLVEKAIVDQQAEKAGISISREELMDLQFGTNLSPVIQNNFRNQQTGQVDMQSILSFKQRIETEGDDLDPNFRLFWSEQEKSIKKTAKQDKLTSMVAKALYTPSFFVEANEKNANATVSFDYVKIPFDQIADGEVSLTDADISAYIKENSAQYMSKEETRTIAYAVKNVYPTPADSAKWKTQMEALADQFAQKAPADDSLFVVSNQGVYGFIFNTADQLKGSLVDQAPSMEVGDVHGPYIDNGFYMVAKLIDKQVLPDSVSARHILRGVAGGDPTQLVAAEAYIDSLENLIRTGRESFADLATANSQDPGSATDGGDLGTFAQGAMVPAFNDAAFIDSKEGGLYKVSTQFGVHLIQVNKRIFNNRDPKYKFAYIRTPITPSQTTQDNVQDEVTEIIDSARDYEALAAAINGRSDMSLETAPAVKKNDYSFATFGSGITSRDIIKWAFEEDTQINEVSPSIYTYTDKVNYFNSQYVVVVLKSVTPPGLPTADAVRGQVELAATNWKKGEILANKITGSDLNAIASQYSATVENAANAKFSSNSVAGIGNEPKVLAAAFGQQEGQVSAPIRGNNGVYLVKTTTLTEGSVVGNIPTVRRTLTSTNRSRAPFSLINALKEKFRAEDNRSKYF